MLIERYEHQTGLRVRFQRRGTQRRLQSTIETALYRIAQEALTNVARHADVSTVSVEIEFTDDLISLQVEDEGKGFSPAAAHAGEHLGLRGIRERAAAVGGILAITAVPGNGTVLTVEIPLRKLNTAP